MSLIISSAISSFTLKIPVTNFCNFLWRTVKELTLASRSVKDVSKSLYLIFKVLDFLVVNYGTSKQWGNKRNEEL